MLRMQLLLFYNQMMLIKYVLFRLWVTVKSYDSLKLIYYREWVLLFIEFTGVDTNTL